MNEKDNPLVSVIVRTKDRPRLVMKALGSIVAQTYRPIEVVLVNDGGCDLDIEMIKTIHKDISLKYIRLEKNTGRAHAANVGIDAASGDYIGFLDDDDELYPDHVNSLLSSLERSGYDIAYSAVEMIEPDPNNKDNPIKSRIVFAREFSYDDLLIWNYIPLISVLFTADIFRDQWFDESFELYEDWDLLIRAAGKGNFYFINTITSRYNQLSDTQIGFKSHPDEVKKAALKIFSKHKGKFSPDLLYRLCVDYEKHGREFAVFLDVTMQKERVVESLNREMEQLKTELAQKDMLIDTMVNTKGWKYLEKYRMMRETIKMSFLKMVGRT
jgi:glycosyltransferase involved in cell wall biosynthesis